MEHAMKRLEARTPSTHDYARALQSAVSWLGDRYLLAEPTPRLKQQQPPPYFNEPHRWHVATRAPLNARR
jgi:hypothetical protein